MTSAERATILKFLQSRVAKLLVAELREAGQDAETWAKRSSEQTDLITFLIDLRTLQGALIGAAQLANAALPEIAYLIQCADAARNS